MKSEIYKIVDGIEVEITLQQYYENQERGCFNRKRGFDQSVDWIYKNSRSVLCTKEEYEAELNLFKNLKNLKLELNK